MKTNKKLTSRNLIILIIAIILLIVIGIVITMARYRSTGTTEVTADVAFTVIRESYLTGNIMLSDLYPREEAFEYDFTITNSDGEHIAETSLDYTMDLKITTNLPLNIKIYKKNTNNTYTELTTTDDIENEIILDESGQNYIRHIKIKNGEFIFNQLKTDEYRLSATFPIEYNEYEAYEGVIDNATIVVEAKQKID